MATAKEEKDEQAFFAAKIEEQNQQRKEQTMANDKPEKPEKRMTYREAIEELTDLIGTPVPIVEAESLKRQLSTVGDPDSELPPDMAAAVENLKNRAKDKDKLTNPGKK